MGHERRHVDEWWGQAVELDFIFYEQSRVERWLEATGFQVQAGLARQPYVPHEVDTQRAYLLAR